MQWDARGGQSQLGHKAMGVSRCRGKIHHKHLVSSVRLCGMKKAAHVCNGMGDWKRLLDGAS